MRFSDYVVDRAFVRAGYKCEACGEKWVDLPKKPKDAPIDVHSANTLHLEMQPNGWYKSVSTPYGHRALKGKLLRPEGFLVYTLLKREDDAFCLCNKCHKKVHDIAKLLSIARLPDKEKKNDIPRILEMVTISFVLNGGKWTS